jgi:flagellar motility protein MotE (MotC chaperone)
MGKIVFKSLLNVLLLFIVCLIIKIGFSCIFKYSTNKNNTWIRLNESYAIAGVEKDNIGQSEKNEKDNSKKEKKTNLENIQKKIGLLQSQINELNSDITILSESITQANSINPETLEKKRIDLENEKKEIDAEKESLNALKAEIDRKVVELTNIQETVRNDLEKKKIVQENRIKQLIKVYTTMPPKKAAALIEKLEMEVVMELFSQMKGENVGEILPYVSPEKAAKISEQLAKTNL